MFLGSSNLSLHEVELSGNNRFQQIETNFYPDSPLFISTGFLPRVSSKRLRLSPPLFSFYIADMPRPTDPVKWVCCADDLTVWASGVDIPDQEVSLNNYLEEITAYLKDNSLLISTPKPRPILLYSSRIHVCRWFNAQGY